MQARIQVDMHGDGNLVDVFHASMGVSFLYSIYDLPNMNGQLATFDVIVPTFITVPMFYVFPTSNAMAYTFDKVSGNTWRITFHGQYFVQFDGRRVERWVNPMIRSDIHKLYVGGYRG